MLAQHATGGRSSRSPTSAWSSCPDLTANKTISVAGASLGYAPPEQYEMGNNRVSAQTDVFSFASVLYEVLCGTEAFPLRHGDSPLRVVARMLTGERPSLARVHATIPRELRDRADLTAASTARSPARSAPIRRCGTASIRELWEQVEPLLDEAMSRSRGRGPQRLRRLRARRRRRASWWPRPCPSGASRAAPSPASGCAPR